jgi:hypothetical protein
LIYTPLADPSMPLPDDETMVGFKHFLLEAVYASDNTPVVQFSRPVTITYPYLDDDVLDSNINEKTLRMLALQQQEWTETSGALDTESNTIVTMQVTTPGEFAVVGNDARSNYVCEPWGEDTPAPQVYSIDPNSGAYDKIEVGVTIKGANFVGTPVVQFANGSISYLLTNVSRSDSQTLLAMTPDRAIQPGTYDVVVYNPDCGFDTLSGGYRVTDDRKPDVRTYFPDRGKLGLLNTLEFFGFYFKDGINVELGTSGPLTTTHHKDTHITSEVPTTVQQGIYDLTLTNLDGGQTVLPGGYTVFQDNDTDLFGYDIGFWMIPGAARVNQANQLGLVVYRYSPQGSQPFENIAVDFYLGDPNNGGTLLGRGTVPMLEAQGTSSTKLDDAVSWTPTADDKGKTFDIYAVIDPDNQFEESREDNNIIMQTVTVLGPSEDQLGPRVDYFSINDGAKETADLTVSFNVEATDNDGGSGIQSLKFIEYQYSESASIWIPVKQSDQWEDYATARTRTWELWDEPGMKYIQAWAKDKEGNISTYPNQQLINYNPPKETVERDRSRTYRYNLKPGETLTVRVTPHAGDPDLYIWPKAEPDNPYVSNYTGDVEEVLTITSEDGGMYQVEVYGYTAAEYDIEMKKGNVAALHMEVARLTAKLTATNPEQDAPYVSVNSMPPYSDLIPPDPIPVNIHTVHLPLISQ